MNGKRDRGAPLLVLIAVLVLLVGLLAICLLPALFYPLGSGPAPPAMEIARMANALQQYESNSHGLEYPPNFDDYELVVAHVQKKFGKYNPKADGVTAPPHDLDPAEALVYWLRGFGVNPVDPLREGTRKSLLTFDQSRLGDADGDGWEEYYPRGQSAPYVYIRHDFYPKAKFEAQYERGVARAYLSDEPDEKYMNPRTFQIIAPGRDDHFGGGGSFPSGQGYAEEDWDNQTNFAEGLTLEEARN